MMRIMAIDYGDARTGLAFSDPGGIIPGEMFTVHERNTARLLDTLDSEGTKRGAKRMVLGLPRNMNGTEGPRAEKTRKLAVQLEERGWEVILWDERRSSLDATRILHENGHHGAKNRARVDAVAAGLILEGYLTRQLTMGN